MRNIVWQNEKYCLTRWEIFSQSWSAVVRLRTKAGGKGKSTEGGFLLSIYIYTNTDCWPCAKYKYTIPIVDQGKNTNAQILLVDQGKNVNTQILLVDQVQKTQIQTQGKYARSCQCSELTNGSSLCTPCSKHPVLDTLENMEQCNRVNLWKHTCLVCFLFISIFKILTVKFRTGVFPDNFVKLIVEEEKRERKPSRWKLRTFEKLFLPSSIYDWTYVLCARHDWNCYLP